MRDYHFLHFEKTEETESPSRKDNIGNTIQRRRDLVLLMMFIFGSSYIFMN